MLTRFASAATVVSVLVALSAVGVRTLPIPNPDGLLLLHLVWCLLPLVWGLWAALLPASWAAERLPVWGGLLGVIAALVVLFGLDLPGALGWDTITDTGKLLLVPAIGVAYSLFWVAVRAVQKRIGRPSAA